MRWHSAAYKYEQMGCLVALCENQIISFIFWSTHTHTHVCIYLIIIMTIMVYNQYINNDQIQGLAWVSDTILDVQVMIWRKSCIDHLYLGVEFWGKVERGGWFSDRAPSFDWQMVEATKWKQKSVHRSSENRLKAREHGKESSESENGWKWKWDNWWSVTDLWDWTMERQRRGKNINPINCKCGCGGKTSAPKCLNDDISFDRLFQIWSAQVTHRVMGRHLREG